MKLLYLLLLLPYLLFPQCPIITQQPQSQTDCDGNSIRMIVMSNGTSFQWEKKRPQDANFTNITGASQAIYQIMPSGNITNPNGTQYRVKISLGACSIYSEQVHIQLRKIHSILNPAICERGNGVLESIQTEGATRFQWTRSVNGGAYLDLIDNDQFQGSQQNQLHITQANQNLDGQKFKIRIDFNISSNNDNEGSTQNLNQTSTCPRTSTEITLQIKPSPTPRHAASTYNGCLNQAFSVNATGCSPYTTQWYDEQRNRIGTGARLNLTLNDSIPYPVFATCINAGCESLPSTGTKAQAFPKPVSPLNAGTPSEICLGLSITFKASGGSNNIWYLTSTSMSPLSTATNYTTSASPANSNITRFVAQNIRGCESERTPIIVRVLPTNLCTPEDSTITPPPIVNPPPADTTVKRLPHVRLSYELHQNCESASYSLTINGCPNVPLMTINRQFTHVGNYYASYVPENQELHITCPESIGSPLDILLPGLNAPEIQIQTNYQNFLCEGDKASLGIQLPLGANMIGWEFNGHLYSQQVSMHERLAAGSYQAIIQRNSCTYRSEFVVIEVRPKPLAPQVISTKNSLCLGDSLMIQTQLVHPFILWNGNELTAKYLLQAKEVGEQKIQVQISDEGTCWSDPSIPLSIQVNPIPEKPELLVQNKGGFCAGDSILVQLNKIGLQYRWSTNDSTQYLYSHIARSYEAKYQDSVGCWSPLSSPVQTILFPPEPQPIIQVKNRQFCQGESITLHATTAFEYAWSTREHADTINVKISNRISLKTRNQYGCWSTPSKTIEIIAQEKPWMPVLTRLGRYFIQATNQEKVTRYEWKRDYSNLMDTSAQLKIKQSGLFQVRAMRTYNLVDAPSVHCYSSYQVASFGIPVDDPGIRIYPNPNRGEQITIEIQDDLKNVQVELISLQGKKIKQWEIKDTMHIQSLNLSDVISGNYILVMYANQWVREKRIFIVSD